MLHRGSDLSFPFQQFRGEVKEWSNMLILYYSDNIFIYMYTFSPSTKNWNEYKKNYMYTEVNIFIVAQTYRHSKLNISLLFFFHKKPKSSFFFFHYLFW